MTTAPARDQARLLDVQALDTRGAQLTHRRRTLPVLADLAAAREQHAALGREVVGAQTLVKDLRREVAKAESDVEQVRARAARDRRRMDSGAGSPKDLQALTHELESLARRQGVLEEAELEVMERLEEAESELTSLTSRAGEMSVRVAELSARADREVAEIDAQLQDVATERVQALDGLDARMITLYERIRSQSGGVGAAALRGTRCEGCRLELNPTDVARIRASGADEVVRCEECGRILVRAEATG